MNGEKPRENFEKENPEQENLEEKQPIEESKQEQVKPILKTSETKEKTEEELSPEVIEKIMEKVQDINKKGTAFTGILEMGGEGEGSDYKRLAPKSLDERFQSVLENGLLGGHLYSSDKPEAAFVGDERKENWVKILRKEKKSAIIYFNMIGRSVHHRGEKYGKTLSKMSDIELWGKGRPILIFDCTSFSENVTGPYPSKMNAKQHESFKQKAGTYTMDYPMILDLGEGRIIRDFGPSEENGFVLSNRVAPRHYRGIVIGHKSNEEELEYMFDKLKDIQLKTYHKRKKMLLPFYDIDGNLLWPKQMSYEEVKKFVEERDKKKEEKEE